MKFPEKVRLSIDVICHLRQITDGKPRRVEDLANTFSTSKNFLHQIVAELSKAEYVSVIKGPRGGVSASIIEVRVLDLFKLFGYLEGEPNTDLASGKIEAKVRKLLAELTV